MLDVALDATLWDAPVTGIGLYGRELWRELAGLAAPGRSATIERWGASRSGEVPRGRLGRTTWTLGVLPGLLRSRRRAVYHALANFNLPLQPLPEVATVLTVHDLVPVLLPWSVSASFRWQFRAWLARSLRVADRIICVSETTRRSLLERFDVDPASVGVVYHGVDHVAATPAADATGVAWLDALGLPEQFVLYAGALDARKNVGLLLDAAERLAAGGRPIAVVLAGQRWFGAAPVERRIDALQRRGLDVRLLGYLVDPVFFALMRRASVFVFPSLYEGFGLPPLEAMSLGVPTVVAAAGAMPEICGGGAATVSPDDPLALAETLDRLLRDGPTRTALGARGARHAQRFRWARTAAQTLGVYEAAVEAHATRQFA